MEIILTVTTFKLLGVFVSLDLSGHKISNIGHCIGGRLEWGVGRGCPPTH